MDSTPPSPDSSFGLGKGNELVRTLKEKVSNDTLSLLSLGFVCSGVLRLFVCFISSANRRGLGCSSTTTSPQSCG
ncbi:hypothetical protein BC936DRAFT_148279 [Jimgerdemannia flammicorona]|uniref:Uncharacterized protein n=1 Tax=Jimgerdemannia flammicorona TaxID=994334 RepID=A0A433D3D6_9FUNG|nr:hypothetical protein BC936DRAFT_148279 [Jimgerdemannia flammicorona]